MTGRAARASWVAVFGLVSSLLVVAPATGNTQGNVGASSTAPVASMTGAPALPSSRTAAKARARSMVVKGRTKKKRAVVRIRGWKIKRKKWVLLKKVRSKRHRYKTRVSLKGVGKRKLKVKRQGQKVRKVRIPEPATAPQPTPQPPSVPPAAPSGPTPAPAEPCGGPVAMSDGTSWSCTFSDEFEGTELDRSKWLPQTTGYTTGDDTNFACYRDSPRHVSVSGDALRLSLTKDAAEPCPGLGGRVTPFSAGSVSTYRLFSQKYGRFEARTRVRNANVSGLHEAFWLWPDDRFVDVTRWPASGEIDIAETYSRYPDIAIPFLHTALDLEALQKLLLGSPPLGLQVLNVLLAGLVPWNLVQAAISNTAWNCAAPRGEWNTYVLEWAPSKIEIFVNGELCLRNTSGDPAFQQPYIVAFTQGIGGDQNTYSDATPLPATFRVDYIRVWGRPGE